MIEADPQKAYEPVTRLMHDSSELIDDPVGIVAARFVVELLDGLVVKLEYFRDGEFTFDGINALTQAAVGSRLGPPGYETVMTVTMPGDVADLYGQTRMIAKVPVEIADLPRLALQGADRIALAAGVDGKPLPAGLTQALQDAIVTDVIADALNKEQRQSTSQDDLATLVDQILTEMSRLSATRVEGQAVSHGVVVNPKVSIDRDRDRYPASFSQKRVPLIFDGQNSVLAVDLAGGAIREVTRQGLAKVGLRTSQLDGFEAQLGDAGSLVALLSSSCRGLGVYLHVDGTIWVFSNGTPLVVKRGQRWRALPMVSLTTGMRILANRSDAGSLIIHAAVLLSLTGHGGILAVVEPDADLDDTVPRKDRVDISPVPGSGEGPTHRVLDLEDVGVQTLVRLAAIDGATIVSTDSRLIAYAAVVSSAASEGEGARTAAARHLSKKAHIVLKVSEDGPITAFRRGNPIGTLLG